MNRRSLVFFLSLFSTVILAAEPQTDGFTFWQGIYSYDPVLKKLKRAIETDQIPYNGLVGNPDLACGFAIYSGSKEDFTCHFTVYYPAPTTIHVNNTTTVDSKYQSGDVRSKEGRYIEAFQVNFDDPLGEYIFEVYINEKFYRKVSFFLKNKQ